MSEIASKTSVTIKKYANRRLYNTTTSAYVTLENLSTMVKDGTEFNVFDAKTSEDITRSVLTQIIMEEENKEDQQNLLPIGFLRQLISFYGDSLQWMVPKYLEQSMESLTGNQDRIREYFKGSVSNMFPFGTTLEDMSKQNMTMFEKTMTMFSPFSGNLSDKLFTSMKPCEATNTTKTAPTKTSATCTTTPCTKKTKDKKSCDIKKPATKTTVKKEKTAKKAADKPTASITSLKPRNENPAPMTKAANTPMPNVKTSTTDTGTDDMQQKISNLQRQLADLAKSRA